MGKYAEQEPKNSRQNYKFNIMKTIRKYSSNKFFISFMTALVFTFSSFGSQLAHKKLFNNVAEKTGEQIFREILFFEGNTLDINIPAFQEQLDVIRNLTPEQNREREQMINTVIGVIHQTRPNYFNEFKNDILSDNPYTIQTAMAEAGQLLVTSLNLSRDYRMYSEFMEANGSNYDLSKKEDVDRLSRDFQQMSGAGVERAMCAWVVVVVALALAVAAAVAWVSFNLWFTEIVSSGNGDYERLEQELLIRQLIANY
jgi:SdpC family antimicrobial peptide